MNATDKADFCSTLKLCYATLLKPLPATDAMNLWFALLDPYSIEQVKAALAQHMRESNFPPVPHDVIGRMPQQLDGHPAANEAWAIALQSHDERNTVVWTQEMATAFRAAAIVLDGGDETGARMAFKEAYERTVAEARRANKPCRWVQSLGHDVAGRESPLMAAVQAGRLQLADARAALPQLAAPADEPVDPAVVAANIVKLRGMVASIETARAQRVRQRAEAAERERSELEIAKRDAAQRVQSYVSSHA